MLDTTDTRIRAEEAVDDIISDLRGRCGLDQGWESIDNDTRRQLREAWIEIVVRANQQETSDKDDGCKRTVVSKPGAVIQVTEIELSPSLQKALTVK